MTVRALPRSVSVLTLAVLALGIGSGWDGLCSVEYPQEPAGSVTA